MAKYKDLIAGSDEESEYGDEDGADEGEKAAHIEAMRKKLLSGLQADTGEYKHKRDLQDSGDDEELDVQFGIGFGEDIGQTLLDKKAEKKEEANKSDFQKW
jgi:hypothetical protein